MAFILKFFPYRIENLLNISSVFPEDLGGFKANIAFIYSALACSLTMSTTFNLNLTFVTRNLIGSSLSDARFDWLVGKMIALRVY